MCNETQPGTPPLLPVALSPPRSMQKFTIPFRGVSGSEASCDSDVMNVCPPDNKMAHHAKRDASCRAGRGEIDSAPEKSVRLTDHPSRIGESTRSRDDESGRCVQHKQQSLWDLLCLYSLSSLPCAIVLLPSIVNFVYDLSRVP
jgi:hypothetical protein